MPDQPPIAYLHQVMAPQSAIIGRERQIRAVRDVLDQPGVRLVTLTGTGGVGKTRLALEVASSHAACTGKNAVFVSLAPLRAPDLILPAIAEALGIEREDGAPLAGLITEHLAGEPLLLLLDNCEHLPAAAPTIAELLEACSSLNVLATSRTPLHLPDERVLDVPPLALPDPQHLPPLPELARTGSVALFVERARATEPGFDLTAKNAKVVAAICARLDGLPLAIELAAVRLQVLSPTSLLSRLTNRLRLLTRGEPNHPDRHQTLRSTIDWSYDQLRPLEQKTFQRLAVFTGGCDLAAAEFVAGLGADVSGEEGRPHSDITALDAIAELLDNALLGRLVVDGEPRFTMLETIREYAIEQLESSGDAPETRKRHAEYFASLAEAAEPALSIGLVEGHWPNRLERDHANLRAALDWSLGQEDPEIGLRLASALVWFWWIRGHLVEGSGWLERALTRSADNRSALRSKLLDGAGKLARTRGDLDHATKLHEESLHIATSLEDDVLTARALAHIALVSEATHHTERAIELFDRALELARRSRQRELLATILTNYGLMKLTNEDQRYGIELLEEGLVMARDLGPSGFLGAILSNLGDARLGRGDHAGAASLYRECLTLQSELGNMRGIADALLGIGNVVLHGGDPRFAARLLASGEALYESIRATPPPPAVRQFADARNVAKASMGEAAFAS
ncbi:MAG: AAA family ATPase, partial [Chloroflexota bacterium]|nr:AAA family ATPase [Chloroflexota bacterium]